MNKVLKGFIITACVFIVIGLGICIGVSVAGGISIAKEMVQNGELSFGRHGFLWHNNKISVDFDNHHATFYNDITDTFESRKVHNLSMNFGAGQIILKTSKDDKITVRSENMGQIQVYVDDETLYLKGKGKRINTGSLEITLPEGFAFDEVDCFIGACRMEFDDLTCDELRLEVGAGEVIGRSLTAKESSFEIGAGNIEISDASLQGASADVGMGNFVLRGDISGDFDGDVGMGNMTLYLSGKESDYNYDYDCAAGNICIGSHSYSGIGGSYLDHESPHTFNLDCGMGHIEINFNP